MAKIDTIDIGSRKIDCLNISEPVGAAGPNQIGDVLVVQALFKYIAASEDLAGIYLGNWSLDGLPEVSGTFDIETFNAIATFKNTWRHRLLNSSDSIIHPANYRGRSLRKYHTGRLMTITLLSYLADDVSKQIAGVTYLERIFHIFPILRNWIEDDGVFHSSQVFDDQNFWQSP